MFSLLLHIIKQVSLQSTVWELNCCVCALCGACVVLGGSCKHYPSQITPYLYYIIFCFVSPSVHIVFFLFLLVSIHNNLFFAFFAFFHCCFFFFCERGIMTRNAEQQQQFVCPIISDISLFSSLLPGSCHASARVVVVDGAE